MNEKNSNFYLKPSCGCILDPLCLEFCLFVSTNETFECSERRKQTKWTFNKLMNCGFISIGALSTTIKTKSLIVIIEVMVCNWVEGGAPNLCHYTQTELIYMVFKCSVLTTDNRTKNSVCNLGGSKINKNERYILLRTIYNKHWTNRNECNS